MGRRIKLVPSDPFTLALALADELVIDSFAGGGGASCGIEAALGRPIDVAINHDPEAISLHTANHPRTTHYCESVYTVHPETATGNQPVGLMWASPDCTHFSRARGGAPSSPRVRGLAWVVVKWARRVKPRVLMLENVEEFAEWGPLLADGSPCPLRRGATFRLWCNQLRAAGYTVEHRILRACDYGAPTSRRRLFVIARRDGLPIVWPSPTHGPGRERPYRTAAECIDWTVETPSIFTRERPLAENTLRRIAHGLARYVAVPDPFVVPTADGPGVPFIAPRYGERPTQAPRTHPVDAPIPTITPDANAGRLVVAWLTQNNTGMVGHDLRKPISTIVGKGCTQSLATAILDAQRPDHARDVAELVDRYAPGGRLAPIVIGGLEYRIADIGMRMLTPRELYRCQGFPDSYRIDVDHDGTPLSKVAQMRMVGNSVPPPVAAAMVRANFAHERAWRAAA